MLGSLQRERMKIQVQQKYVLMTLIYCSLKLRIEKYFLVCFSQSKIDKKHKLFFITRKCTQVQETSCEIEPYIRESNSTLSPLCTTIPNFSGDLNNGNIVLQLQLWYMKRLIRGMDVVRECMLALLPWTSCTYYDLESTPPLNGGQNCEMQFYHLHTWHLSVI